MKITLLLVGKTEQSYIAEGMNVYCERLKHYLPFEVEVIPNVKASPSTKAEKLCELEGEQILARISASDYLILLDEKGKQFTSLDFAEHLQKKMLSGCKRLVFVVGGAFGFSPAVYAAAREKVSLSKMTFSHQMVRLFMVEQIYRAMTILKGEPYHHE